MSFDNSNHSPEKPTPTPNIKFDIFKEKFKTIDRQIKQNSLQSLEKNTPDNFIKIGNRPDGRGTPENPLIFSVGLQNSYMSLAQSPVDSHKIYIAFHDGKSGEDFYHFNSVVEKDISIIGRNNINIQDSGVSRQHFELQYSKLKQSAYIRDISTNGSHLLVPKEVPKSQEVLVSETPCGATDVGLKRKNNEDSFFISPNIYIVGDGVGGADHGEYASSQLCKKCRHPNSIVRDIQGVSNSLSDFGSREGKTIATTALAAVSHPENSNSYKIYNVGDSPAYLVDTKAGAIREITVRDEKQGYGISGKLQNVLSHSVGGEIDPPVHRYETTLSEGQSLLLVTDGFSDYVDRGQITKSQILNISKNLPPQTAVKKLIELAKNAGGKDNITVVLIPHRKK